jgi:hypothetical protein
MSRLELSASHLHRKLADAEGMLHPHSHKLPEEEFDQRIARGEIGWENWWNDPLCTAQEEECTHQFLDVRPDDREESAEYHVSLPSVEMPPQIPEV